MDPAGRRRGGLATGPVLLAATTGALVALVLYGHPGAAGLRGAVAAGVAPTGVGRSLRVDLDVVAPPPRLPTLPPATPESRTSRPPVPLPAASGSSPPLGCTPMDLRVVELLDEDRTASGLAPLTPDPALCRAAAVHAAQNAAQDRMFHEGVSQDVDAQGVNWHVLGEVLGEWRPTPDAVSINRLWMESAEHRPIVLGTGYLRVGVGWARSATGDWFVSAILVS